jgi:polyisoprenoid-binding protein YceI
MRAIFIIAAALVNACAAAAGSPTPAIASIAELPRDPSVTRVAADMPSGEYRLDPAHTTVHWRLRHWGLSPYTGRFDSESGALAFDPANPTQSSVTVRIPVSSVSTGHRNREGQLAFDPLLANLLGGEAQPEIVFTSTSIEQTSATTGRIHGDLSFNGQTHPVTLEAVFEGGLIVPTNQRPTLGFTARTIIARSLWLGERPSLINAGEEIEIIVSAEFTRPGVEPPATQ